jgi:hypothetical protein
MPGDLKQLCRNRSKICAQAIRRQDALGGGLNFVVYCVMYGVFLGLARTIQVYMCTLYMTVCLVISLPGYHTYMYLPSFLPLRV